MEIYILDGTTLNRLGIVDEYESFIWNTSYNNIGTFELKCGIGFFGLLQADRLVQCTEDLKHNGVIEHILKVTNDDGSESIQIKGRMAEILLDRRLCMGEYAYESQQPAVIASSLITKNAIENRPIEHLEIGTLTDADEGVIDYAGANKSLCEEVQAVCQPSLLGFNLRADTDRKKLVFDTYKGLNRTEEDNTVTHIEENTAENLLANGFFSSGFDGWTEVNNYRAFDYKKQEYISDYPMKVSSGIVSKCRYMSIGEDEKGTYDFWKPSAYLTQAVNLNSEHVYYMAARCKNPQNAVLSFGIKDGDTIYLNFEKSGEWAEKGCLYVPSASGKYTFYAGYGELPEEEEQYVYWDYCILLDLTATFGIGKEPTLDFCKKNIYFSGDTLMYKTEIIEFVENHTPPLVFSRDRDTLLSVEYEKSIVNECTYLYVQGEGDISTVLTSGDTEGLKLKEKYLDLSSSVPRTVDGVELPEASYIAMLENTAKATMRQLVVNEIIDGTLYKLSNKQFGKDFYLGDIACFTDKAMNYTVNLRISAVQQVWDSNGYTVTVTLGDDVPNIIETIKLVGKGAK